MENPDNQRPNLPKEILNNLFSIEEEFQNSVLRPIIKLQSDLIIAHTFAKIKSLNNPWDNNSLDQRRETLSNLLTKDLAFKKELIGIVVGRFSLEEHRRYCFIQQNANKRITQIIHNRCSDIMLNSLLNN